MRHFLTGTLAVCLLVGCGTMTPQLETGPNAEITHDGLHRVDRSSRFQRVWVRPGASLAGYDKLLLVGSGIHYKRDPAKRSDEFPLSERQMDFLRAGLTDAIAASVEKHGQWEIVTERGPDVLVMRGAIIDLVFTAGPGPIGRDRSYSSTVGAATLVVELYDSESMEILVRIADRRQADRDWTSWRNDSITNRAAASRVFRAWARLLGSGLDRARRIGLPGETRPADPTAESPEPN